MAHHEFARNAKLDVVSTDDTWIIVGEKRTQVVIFHGVVSHNLKERLQCHLAGREFKDGEHIVRVILGLWTFNCIDRERNCCEVIRHQLLMIGENCAQWKLPYSYVC